MIKLARNNEQLNKGISKYQCGVKKGRSTVDDIMMLNPIIAYNQTIKSKTYILFADAYKFFDKLTRILSRNEVIVRRRQKEMFSRKGLFRENEFFLRRRRQKYLFVKIISIKNLFREKRILRAAAAGGRSESFN